MFHGVADHPQSCVCTDNSVTASQWYLCQNKGTINAHYFATCCWLDFVTTITLQNDSVMTRQNAIPVILNLTQ